MAFFKIQNYFFSPMLHVKRIPSPAPPLLSLTFSQTAPEMLIQKREVPKTGGTNSSLVPAKSLPSVVLISTVQGQVF